MLCQFSDQRKIQPNTIFHEDATILNCFGIDLLMEPKLVITKTEQTIPKWHTFKRSSSILKGETTL